MRAPVGDLSEQHRLTMEMLERTRREIDLLLQRTREEQRSRMRRLVTEMVIMTS
jgi:hypothetical protein